MGLDFSKLNEVVEKRENNATVVYAQVVSFEQEIDERLRDSFFTGVELDGFSTVVGNSQLSLEVIYIDCQREVFLTLDNKRIPNTKESLIDDDYISIDGIQCIFNNRPSILESLIDYLNGLK